ncbi:MAG: ABC transporter permease subunit [Lachnospiraceae bacterium]|nr:ABC transporter permease subunit [Lachnospiraceae bacterium]
MLQLELYKIMKRKLVWIVLLGILLLSLLQLFGYLRYQYFDQKSHEELKREVQTLEKHKGILTDERLADFFKDYQLKEYDYMNDWIADGKLVPVEELFADVNFKIHFGYFEQWLFSWEDLSSYIAYIPIFVAIAFSSIFTYEKECGMQEILLSTRRGRRECTRAKVAAAFLITNILYLLLIFLAILPVILLTGGRGWDTSIQMTPWMRDSLLDMNYGEAYLHTFYLGFIAVNVILLITLSASFLVKSPVVAMCVSLGVLFVWRPDAIAVHVGTKIANRITAMTPLNVINTKNLAQQVPVTIAGMRLQWLFLAELLYTVLLVGGGIFFFRVLTRHQKYYAS